MQLFANRLPLTYASGSVRRTLSTRRHVERRLFKFSPEQVYKVVADVKRYRDFVPWCVNSEVISEEGNRLEATLEIGFGSLRERYTSTVTLEPFSKITSDSPQTTFIDRLITSWTFTAGNDPKTCWVTFNTEFKFKSILYSKISDMFFNDVTEKMVKAFESRCQLVYKKLPSPKINNTS